MFNLKIDINALSPPIRWAVSPGQRDGIETYVLYFLTFACIVLTVLLVWLYDSLERFHKKYILIFFFFIFILGVYFFYLNIGFYPPMSNPGIGLTLFIPMVVVMFVLWLLIKIASRKEWVASLSIIILLIPICFVATSPISLNEILLGLDFNKSVVNDGFKFVWKSQ